MTEKLHSKWIRLIMVIFGSFLYALGLNAFIVPLDLFSGGAVGIAQLLTLLVKKITGAQGANLYGIIYFAINLPLLFLAWKSMGRRFFVMTILGALSISLFTVIVPVQTIIEETITSVILGGIISGIGIGIVLTAGGCGGGLDIICVWATKKYKNMSVGKISMAVNAAIFAVLLLKFDIKTFIYSAIYMAFFTFVLDKAHYQNINIRLMIFTKKKGIDKKINQQTGRGVTEWKGIGAYTGDETSVLVSCINKYELGEFMEIIKSIDPEAFVIADEGVYVSGNFEKRL